MKYLLCILSVVVLSSSCVSKRKYNAVVKDIESKQKQQQKLEQQISQLAGANKKLRDSAALIQD